jgi:hypothetical protein
LEGGLIIGEEVVMEGHGGLKDEWDYVIIALWTAAIMGEVCPNLNKKWRQ